MYYEINVAKKRKGEAGFEHYFATAERSITTTRKAIEIGKQFNELFPFPEYSVSISLKHEISTGAEINTFLNDPELLNKVK